MSERQIEHPQMRSVLFVVIEIERPKLAGPQRFGGCCKERAAPLPRNRGEYARLRLDIDDSRSVVGHLDRRKLGYGVYFSAPLEAPEKGAVRVAHVLLRLERMHVQNVWSDLHASAPI